ncbi:MAG: GntR family transcriptional regulator [Gemmatimonadetes bacterium]|nr:GntR family transcriptional regulator [Gemmatimonadota bacterium]MDA1104400.1 GntR family transcriptional regulator [Gemmatimonadota bacterium]
MAEPTLHPIEQTSLRVQVAERLRTAIITGKLRPGDALTETALAEQLNVSRAPVREAIQDLENDGLVETVAYRGKRVKPLTVREVSEIREMRQHFEVMAVQRILDQGTGVVELWAPCRAMEEAAAQGDRDALIAADEAFHRTMIRLSDNQLLAQLWAGLYLRILQIMSLRNDQNVDLTDIAGTHPPIVRALESGDAEGAVRLVSEHFDALASFDPATIAGDPK